MAFEAVSLLQHRVSMHLMVLGASRPRNDQATAEQERVSMHLMVLGASRPGCPFNGMTVAANVSMHLMVLGASRLFGNYKGSSSASGSQCT